MNTLLIENIECHAFHGCLPEETKIGGRFSVDVLFEGDMKKAIDSDDLSQAIDYVTVYNLVKEEMLIASKLIEHAAGRILNRLASAYPSIKNITVTLKKYNPPVNGFTGAAVFSVSLR